MAIQWSSGRGEAMNRQLLVDIAMQLYKETLHSDAIWREMGHGKDHVLHFTHYEGSLPLPCQCEGCTYYREHEHEARERLEKLSTSEILALFPEPSYD